MIETVLIREGEVKLKYVRTLSLVVEMGIYSLNLVDMGRPWYNLCEVNDRKHIAMLRESGIHIGRMQR